MNSTMKLRKIGVGMLLALSVLAYGCLEESENSKIQDESDRQIAAYLETNDIEAMQSQNGLYYEKLIANDDGDSPESGDVLIVKYVLKTLDGNIIASELADTTLFQFSLGRIIPDGIGYCADAMKTGETVRFYLPSYLAYNGYRPDDNSFNSYQNFIVEMELVDIKTEEEIDALEIAAIEDYIETQQMENIISSASGLYFKSIESGEGETAKSFNKVTFHYIRKYLDGTVIQTTPDNDPLEVYLNQGHLVEGLGQGLLNMKAGETAIMIMPSNLAFGASVQIMPETLREELYEDGFINNLVAPYSPVIYEVELLEIE